MIPLKTVQGLEKNDLKNLINNRKVYIWGNGVVAQMVISSLNAMGIRPVALLDNRHSHIGRKIRSLIILDIEILSNINKSEIFIIIASEAIIEYAKDKLIRLGFIQNRDFISFIKIARPVAAIDIYSGCNIQCITCPQSNNQNLKPLSIMSYKNFCKVLDKLIIEIPHLSGIELFTWGEPLLNEDVVEIIEYTLNFVPCIVSTNLQKIDKLIDIMKIEPTLFIVSLNSLGDDYEKISKGASWRNLLDNLKFLGNIISQGNNTNVEVRLYNYKSTLKEDIDWFKHFCKENGLRLVINYTYVNTYENYLNNEIAKNTNYKIMKNIHWDYNKILELAKKDKELPCLCQRIFPIINADLSVSLCHTYYGPIISNNYLNITLDCLINIRHNQRQCELCQLYGLHRLDLQVLQNRFPKQFNNAFEF